MDINSPEIAAYAELYSEKESDVLRELNRETHAKVLMPRMLSGHLQGRVLSFFSHLLRPMTILEIGTYTGYSAICLSEGLQPGGMLHTIDINDELVPLVKRYFEKAGCGDKIRMHTGNAVKIIPQLDETFDLVFIDADKKNYSVYFDMVIGKMRKGGLIIADNVLWSGKVLEPEKEMDSDTQALAAFNQKIQSDPRVSNLLLPVRDGLLLMRVL